MQAKIAAIVFFVYLNLLVETAGQYFVTLVVFSGRPDPEWFIPGADKRLDYINNLIGAASKNKQIGNEKDIPSKLGYRGFLLKENMNGPQAFIAGPNTIKLQMALLDTFDMKDFNNIQADVFQKFKKEVNDAIQASGPQNKPTNQKKLNQGFQSSSSRIRLKRYVHMFEPNYWNVHRTQSKNNCYNYANNKATDTFAQPGRGSGHPEVAPLIAQSATFVRNAANNDGLENLEFDPLPNQPIPNNPNGKKHLVALFIRTLGVDYHWIRRDFDGTWSHKIGGSPATKLGQIDPRTAHAWPYQFVCFMYSNRDTVTIA